MKRLMLATALVTAWAGIARADDSFDRVAEVYGEAAAFGEMCPALKFSDAAMTFYAGAAGVNIDDGVISEAGFFQRKAFAEWGTKPAGMACAQADRLFGPSGSKAPSLLVRE
ncbi:hypothetical protein [Mesorhizobium sp. CA4]|uniref:hypothetical protein n=1 Tax=Mesorhizobium sp. CA4 TaxID=588499 RepID=UPI001CD1763D|nr:hypothetical protein [Mesorhizobium sp. CA4]MBZ9822312.1 hypothetical protein [Mesorhizobium sp. CA4]